MSERVASCAWPANGDAISVGEAESLLGVAQLEGGPAAQRAPSVAPGHRFGAAAMALPDGADFRQPLCRTGCLGNAKTFQKHVPNRVGTWTRLKPVIQCG